MKAPKRRGRPEASATSAGGSDASPESWDHVASWYDAAASDLGTALHQEVVVPGVLRLLEVWAGEAVLDVGCGQGVVSRALGRAGAQVTGVDLSPRLIRMAQQRSAKTIRYLVGDARRLEALADRAFDAVVCALAAQNMEPLEPALAEWARLLRPGGRLVLVINHPAFRIPRQSGWRWDEERQLLVRTVDRYLTPLKIPIDMRPFKSPGQKTTWTYHRPLQTYVNGLAAAGLAVSALEEWPSPRTSQPGPQARAENRARAEFPLFLALRAVRL